MTSRWYSVQCGRPNPGLFIPSLKDPKHPRLSKSAATHYCEENLSSYVLYYDEEERRFRDLPEEEQAKYKQLAQEDEERYRTEMAAYKPSSGWIDERTGDYKTIVDWHTGYLPSRSGTFPPAANAEGSESVPKKQKVAKDHVQSPWSNLNAEIVSLVASFLDHPRDAFSMCYVCSNWKSALSDPDSVAQEAVWRPLAMSRFPQLFLPVDGSFDEKWTCHTFALKDSRFTYRDVFIVHDRVIGMDHNAPLAPPDKSNQIHREGLKREDFMLTYVFTHYNTRSQCASQYTFGMGILETMEHVAVVPNFHDMVHSLVADYDSDMGEPRQDESAIPVLRCFLTGPGYRTVQIAKFIEFDSDWGGQNFYYCYSSSSDQSEVFPNTLNISGCAMSDYRQDDLRFDFEGDELEPLIDIFTRLFRGQTESNDADDAAGDTRLLE